VAASKVAIVALEVVVMTEVAEEEEVVVVMEVTKVLDGAVSIKVAEEDLDIMEVVAVETMEEKRYKILYLSLDYQKESVKMIFPATLVLLAL